MARVGRAQRIPPFFLKGADPGRPAATWLGDAFLQAVATMTPDASKAFGGEVALQGVATFQADGPLGHQGEAALVGVATMTAEVEAVVFEAEAFLQAVSYMAMEPDHTSPSPRWARRVGDPGSSRLVPGEQRIGGRRMKRRSGV